MITDLVLTDKNQEKTAVSTDEGEFSYGELFRKIERISAHLEERQLKEGSLVGVMTVSPVETIAAVQAALNCRMVPVPLDTGLAAKRLEHWADQLNLEVIIHDEALPFTFNGKCIDTAAPSPAVQHRSNKPAAGNTDGEDKGALFFPHAGFTDSKDGLLLSHSALIHWLNFNSDTLGIDFSRTLFICSSGSVHSFPLWIAALHQGNRLDFHSVAPVKDGQVLPLSNTFIKKMQDATAVVLPLNLVDALFTNDAQTAQLLASKPSLVTMGEEVPENDTFMSHVKKEKIKYYNYYLFPEIQMITKCTGGRSDTYSHFGKPVKDTAAYILDKNRNLLPIGVEGDLYLSGRGPCSLSQKRYIDNPFVREKDAAGKEDNLYITGLRAKWSSKGLLALSNKEGNVFSLQGRRVEAGEIKRILSAHPSVKECAVHLNQAGTGITVYIAADKDISFDRLQADLAEALPREVLPVSFAQLAGLPRDAKGRVDLLKIREADYLDSLRLEKLERRYNDKHNTGTEIALLADEPGESDPVIHVASTLKKGQVDLPGAEKRDESFEQAPTIPDNLPPALSDGGPLIIDPDAPVTLTGALLAVAETKGHKGIQFVDADGEAAGFKSYTVLLEEAKHILGGLQKVGLKPGDKVILQFKNLNDYFSAFWGCVLGGIIPVTVAVANTYKVENAVVNKLYNIWKLLDFPPIIAEDYLTEELSNLKPLYRLDSIDIFSISSLKDTNTPGRIFDASPEDIVFFQLTSGSTGVPKCIQETHRGIIAHIHHSAQYNDYSGDDITLNWLPTDHVVPILTFHLKDTYLGCTQIEAKTDDVIADPLLWLRLMEQYRVTHSWAPNFAFSLVNKELAKDTDVSYDLSQVKFLMNAGEQVTRPVVDEFARRTASFGLKTEAMQPAFGMAEVCTCMTYNNDFDVERSSHFFKKQSLTGQLIKTDARDPDGICFIDLGGPVNGVAIRITDKQNRVLPEGFIGRFQIKGAVVTPGYYRNDEANREAFVGDGWFNSGDLGFILDGRLTLTGREKEMIIINGANYYCYEIEDIVSGMDGVIPSFVGASSFYDPLTGTEALSIFFSPENYDIQALPELINKIRSELSLKIGISPARVIPLEREHFAKTTSGKIQRTKMKKTLEAGGYDDIITTLEILTEDPEKTVPNWFYEKSLQAVALDNDYRYSGKKCFLVCRWGEDDYSSISEQLSAAGHQVVDVECGSTFARKAEDRFSINPANEDDYRKLFETLTENGVTINTIDTMIHLGGCGVDDFDHQATTIDTQKDIERYFDRTLYSLLYLSRAAQHYLTRLDAHHGIELVVVTENCEHVRDDEIAFYPGAVLRGFLKSLAGESTGMTVTRIDFDRLTREQSTLLLDELFVTPDYRDKARDIVYRQGQRHTLSLKKSVFDSTQPGFSLVKGGCYLVTGGLGGVGSVVSQWLLNEYGARLLIIGRTKPGSLDDKEGYKHEVLQKLQNSGGAVLFKAGDIADYTFLEEAVKEAEREFDCSLDGIFHLAGDISQVNHSENNHWQEMSEHLIVHEKKENFHRVFQSKVTGSLNLHRLRAGNKQVPLIAFSSVNSFFGGSSLGAYSAANSFLNGFIRYCKATGFIHSYSLNWSMWDNKGMSSRIPDDISAASSAGGYRKIGELQGINSLKLALLYNKSELFIGLDEKLGQIGASVTRVSPLKQLIHVIYRIKEEGAGINENRLLEDVKKLTASYTTTIFNKQFHPFLVDGFPRKDDTLTENAVIDKAQLAEMIHSLTAGSGATDEPQNETEKDILFIVEEIIGHKRISVNENLFNMGLNSLMITKLFYKLKDFFQEEIPVNRIIQNPTIRSIAAIAVDLHDNKENRSDIYDDKELEIDFKKESILDPSIRPAAEHVVLTGEPKNLFITGSTGFVGAFLLAELLKETDAHIYCLVRARDNQAALKKIEQNLAHYRLWKAVYADRITPVTGDLAKPELGMDAGLYRKLCRKIEMIYHCGAMVNYTYPYYEHKAANVIGTENVLRFATKYINKPIHHISTISFMLKLKEQSPVIKEAMLPSDCTAIINGYMQSKWVAEELMIKARNRGIAVSIYRLGEVFGDCNQGINSELDFIWRLLKGCIQLRLKPAITWSLYITPVDYISQTITALSKRADNIGKTYHVLSPQVVTINEIFDSLEENGYVLKELPYQEWRQSIIDRVEKEKDNPIFSLLTTIPKTDIFTTEELPVIDCSNTTGGLPEQEILCPEINGALLGKYVNYFIDTGFFEQPPKSTGQSHQNYRMLDNSKS